MNVQDDWNRWAGDWQQQPSVDIDRLRHRVSRKLWRMRMTATLELLVSAVAVWQTWRLIMQPGIDLRWKLWAACAMLLVLVGHYLVLRARRGTWRASGSDAGDLLQLTARRAIAGIRLATLNSWSLLLMLAVTLVVAAPDLMPAHWQHDAKLKSMILLQCAVNLPIVVIGFVGSAWYIRRQRRHLREVKALLREHEDWANRFADDRCG
jgi:hypothetical protein